ncbi:MAG: hypothetical protein HXK27_01635 [Atopobium sp.]|uniref:Uncharacterized protein n=2 Tax=root TaxID=1 RepID=A0A9E7APQ9_9ACTN|nr:hypothetical protein [Atopobium sp.]UQF78277.1 MAG: hypothetical protein M3I19_00820 [Lancefieldella parvula]
MDAKEIKKICDFLASMPNDAVTSADLVDPVSGIVIQHGYCDHHIGNMGVSDQDILKYRAGVEQIPDFAIEYAKQHMK